MVLNYHINKKSITEKYCENRDKPQMHCNGHCYLAKQLKQAEEKDAPVPNFNHLKELSPYLATTYENIRFNYITVEKTRQIFYHVTSPLEACSGAVFQPPEV